MPFSLHNCSTAYSAFLVGVTLPHSHLHIVTYDTLGNDLFEQGINQYKVK